MDATPEQTAEGAALVRVLAAVLDRLVGANALVALSDPGQVTKFHALKAPGIGILQYLERIHKYGSCSNECFVLALIYIDRLIQRNNFLLTELNVHRVVITAILLAAKFFDDAYYNNAYYAKVGGVLVSEMNGLEVDFLFRINFSLHVTSDLFHKYREQLVSQANGPSVQTKHEYTPMPVAPVIRQVASPNHGAMIHHQTVYMTDTESVNSLQSVSQTHSHYIHGNERQYITPSPPDSSAMAARVHPNGTDMMAPGNSGGLAAAMQASLETAHLASTSTRSYMQPSGASHPVSQHWRCSPQVNYNGVTVGPPPAHLPNHVEQFVVFDNVSYAYGTTLVHHHHAVNETIPAVEKPHNGYNHKQHHTNPAYVAPVSDSNHHYFTSGHMITGTSGS